MAYSDFTFSKVKEAFQLTIDEKTNLFANTAKKAFKNARAPQNSYKY